jgi:protein required for attachment to host cells
VLDVDRASIGPATAALVEVADLTNPMLRARDVEAVSDTRTNQRGGARTPLRATSDHRDHRRRDLERRFAASAAAHAADVWRRYAPCELIVVASPVMLGLLRPAIDRQIRSKDQIVIRELARDLTKLSAPMLHDLLSEAALLPERGRRAPLKPAPGRPVEEERTRRYGRGSS